MASDDLDEYDYQSLIDPSETSDRNIANLIRNGTIQVTIPSLPDTNIPRRLPGEIRRIMANPDNIPALERQLLNENLAESSVTEDPFRLGQTVEFRSIEPDVWRIGVVQRVVLSNGLTHAIKDDITKESYFRKIEDLAIHGTHIMKRNGNITIGNKYSGHDEIVKHFDRILFNNKSSGSNKICIGRVKDITTSEHVHVRIISEWPSRKYLYNMPAHEIIRKMTDSETMKGIPYIGATITIFSGLIPGCVADLRINSLGNLLLVTETQPPTHQGIYNFTCDTIMRISRVRTNIRNPPIGPDIKLGCYVHFINDHKWINAQVKFIDNDRHFIVGFGHELVTIPKDHENRFINVINNPSISTIESVETDQFKPELDDIVEYKTYSDGLDIYYKGQIIGVPDPILRRVNYKIQSLIGNRILNVSLRNMRRFFELPLRRTMDNSGNTEIAERSDQQLHRIGEADHRNNNTMIDNKSVEFPSDEKIRESIENIARGMQVNRIIYDVIMWKLDCEYGFHLDSKRIVIETKIKEIRDRIDRLWPDSSEYPNAVNIIIDDRGTDILIPEFKAPTIHGNPIDVNKEIDINPYKGKIDIFSKDPGDNPVGIQIIQGKNRASGGGLYYAVFTKAEKTKLFGEWHSEIETANKNKKFNEQFIPHENENTSEYICLICFSIVPLDVRLTVFHGQGDDGNEACQHFFCKSCIFTTCISYVDPHPSGEMTKGNYDCPNCRRNINILDENGKPDNLIRDQIKLPFMHKNSLNILKNFMGGCGLCGKEFKYEDYMKHRIHNKCVIRCPYENCKMEMKSNNYNDKMSHFKNECKGLWSKCIHGMSLSDKNRYERCDFEGTIFQVVIHLNQCPHQISFLGGQILDGCDGEIAAINTKKNSILIQLSPFLTKIKRKIDNNNNNVDNDVMIIGDSESIKNKIQKI